MNVTLPPSSFAPFTGVIAAFAEMSFGTAGSAGSGSGGGSSCFFSTTGGGSSTCLALPPPPPAARHTTRIILMHQILAQRARSIKHSCDVALVARRGRDRRARARLSHLRPVHRASVRAREHARHPRAHEGRRRRLRADAPVLPVRPAFQRD